MQKSWTSQLTFANSIVAPRLTAMHPARCMVFSSSVFLLAFFWSAQRESLNHGPTKIRNCLPSETLRRESINRNSYSPQPRYRNQHHGERDRKDGTGNQERTVQASLVNRPLPKGAGSVPRPPVCEQAERMGIPSQEMADHGRNERSRRPRQKPKQPTCAKHDGNHPHQRPRLRQVQSHKQERRYEDRNPRPVAIFDRPLHVSAKSSLFANPRRCRRHNHCDPSQRKRRTQRKDHSLAGKQRLERLQSGKAKRSQHAPSPQKPARQERPRTIVSLKGRLGETPSRGRLALCVEARHLWPTIHKRPGISLPQALRPAHPA